MMHTRLLMATLSLMACSGFPECGDKFLKLDVGVPDSVYMDRLKPAHMDLAKPMVVAQPAQREWPPSAGPTVPARPPDCPSASAPYKKPFWLCGLIHRTL